MPCFLAILIVAFPRIAIALLYLFTSFFTGVYNSVLLAMHLTHVAPTYSGGDRLLDETVE